MNIRGQHYVWRHYLEAWAKGKSFHCLRDGKIFPVQPKNIAKERDFYRLKEMTPEDVFIIEKLAIESSPEHLQASHRELLDNFHTIAKLGTLADLELQKNAHFKKQVNTAINNAEELLHGSI